MIRLTMMAATALLALATAAGAQEADPTAAQPAPIVTRAATPTQSAPPTTAPTMSASANAQTADATDRQIAAWIGDGVDTSGKSVPGLVSAMPVARDRAIHGEVGASIGSGGYRSGYAIANMPIGEHSDVTVAIGDEHLGGGNRRRGGYGYGFSGGDRQSLAIAVNLNGVGRGAPAAADCDRDAPPKWSLGLPDDAALSNRCRRLLQSETAPPRH